MTKPTIKQIVAEMNKNGSPVRLDIRNLPMFGGWCIEGQDFLPLGGAFKTHEDACAARSKALVKAWEIYDAA